MSNRMFKSKSYHAPIVGGNTARIPSTPGTGRVLKTNALVMKSPYPKCTDEFNRLSKISNQAPTTTLNKKPEKDQLTIIHIKNADSNQNKNELSGAGELELSEKEKNEKKREIDKLLKKSAIEGGTVKVPPAKKRKYTEPASSAKGSKKKQFNFSIRKK